MLRARVIPVLLLRDKGLVKTTKFTEDKYVGDPLNAVRIFNEKEADELVVFDIDATVRGLEPDYRLIESMASECRMPLCYGGGIKTLDQALKILSLGVEKVALSSAAIDRPVLISDIVSKVGAQSVVIVLDVKKKMFGGYTIFTHNGKLNTKINLFDFIPKIEALEVGELIVNCIDLDGTMKGYDAELIDAIKLNTKIPFTICGGAGCHADLENAIRGRSPIGVAAGSLFVFKGKYRAVLINYPNTEEKERIVRI